jgi:hypothetical protein
MLLGVDHLVIAVPDPDAAAAALEGALGLAATGGGRHESGTWNRLVFLGDAYLELIGVWDAGRAAAHPIGAAALAALRGAGAGLATLALATDGIATDTAALRAAGSAISPPVPGSRLRADGERVAWQTAAGPQLGPDQPPFLIEHEMAGPEWGDAARAERARFEHPFGGTARLVGVEIPVPEPAATAEAWSTTLGVHFAPASAADAGSWEAQVGDHHLGLVPAGDTLPTPPAVVAILGSASLGAVVDLLGVRFVRL